MGASATESRSVVSIDMGGGDGPDRQTMAAHFGTAKAFLRPPCRCHASRTDLSKCGGGWCTGGGGGGGGEGGGGGVARGDTGAPRPAKALRTLKPTLRLVNRR